MKLPALPAGLRHQVLLPDGVGGIADTAPPGDLVGLGIRCSDNLQRVVAIHIGTAGEAGLTKNIVYDETGPCLAKAVLVAPPLNTRMNGVCIRPDNIHVAVRIQVSGIRTQKQRVVLLYDMRGPAQ